MLTCKVALLWSFDLATQLPLLHVNAVKEKKVVTLAAIVHADMRASIGFPPFLLVNIKRHGMEHVAIGKAVRCDKPAAAASILCQPIDTFSTSSHHKSLQDSNIAASNIASQQSTLP
jgi:hypothetical protein